MVAAEATAGTYRRRTGAADGRCCSVLARRRIRHLAGSRGLLPGSWLRRRVGTARRDLLGRGGLGRVLGRTPLGVQARTMPRRQPGL